MNDPLNVPIRIEQASNSEEQIWALDAHVGPEFIAVSEQRLRGLLTEFEQRMVKAVVREFQHIPAQQRCQCAASLKLNMRHARSSAPTTFVAAPASEADGEAASLANRASTTSSTTSSFSGSQALGRKSQDQVSNPEVVRQSSQKSMETIPESEKAQTSGTSAFTRTSKEQPKKSSGFRFTRPQPMTLAQREAALRQAAADSLDDGTTMGLNMFKSYEEEVSLEGDRLNFVQLTTTRITKNPWFSGGVSVLIVANVLLIGLQADYAVRHVSGDDPLWMQIFDIFFTLAFTVELALRLCAEGLRHFFLDPRAYRWNCFDSFLVLSSVAEELVKILWFNAPNMSAMRVLRVFRFVRVARVVRVARIFSDLRIMVSGIFVSLKSLVWAILLLFLLAFMFGVLILEFVAGQLLEMDSRPEMFPADLETTRSTLIDHWGSLLTATYTLFLAISGGMDWGDAAGPLIEISWFFGACFCLYVAVAVFCMLNIVTGVFVENTKNMLSKDETHLIMETIESRKQWLDEVKALWKSFEAEGNVDLKTFVSKVEDVRVQALFRRLGLEVESENASGLFALLDFDSSGVVEIDEFATGVQMLHGQAKNIDMARLHHMMRVLQRQVGQLATEFGIQREQSLSRNNTCFLPDVYTDRIRLANSSSGS
mmetsp:Transcript_142830/g.362583  ORF Transcript_142830/g.362583 Transcript_142830/m.362583 type:complete len:653 (+) Transcript_142830:68-2026(+)